MAVHLTGMLNDTTIKHRILGIIAATPNGVTQLTITTLAAEPGGLTPRRIRELLTNYTERRYIKDDDGVYTPTPKLLRERDTWQTARERPPATVKPGAPNPSRRPVTTNHRERASIVRMFMETTETYKTIGAAHNIGKSKAYSIITDALTPEEFQDRSVVRRRLQGRARRTTGRDCGCGQPMTWGAKQCLECHKATVRNLRAQAAEWCELEAMGRAHLDAGTQAITQPQVNA